MALRISLTGGGATVDRLVAQAVAAEDDGFAGLWYPGGGGALDPLVLLPLVGRATSRIALGTAVVQTYPRHPVLTAQQAATVAAVLEDPSRFTLGVGVSHRPVIEGVYGLSYDTNARHLREYLTVLDALRREGSVRYSGDEYVANTGGRPVAAAGAARGGDARDGGAGATWGLVVAALASRSLGAAGELADGTITWMANARAVASLIAPAIRKAADDAARPEPRVVVGLPVAVTDDEDAGREAAARQFTVYGTLPNYQRVLAAGGVSSPAEAALVGDEQHVGDAVAELFAAGATEVWAAPFPVGDDRSASRRRTRALLRDLVTS
jgi:F420-dependent oxidoreductase-like protein